MRPSYPLHLFAIVCFFLFAKFATAQEVKTDSTFRPQIKPSLNITRRQGEITIDGDLDDAGWLNAATAKDFTASFPVPNQQPPVQTFAKITYDDEYLYVAMIAKDPHPEAIRASMVGRDNISNDDFMGIILDTYGDGTRAFEIYCNPLGVQEDLFWSANNEDGSYDMIYQSEAKITATGWQSEMKIPFKSLRFPDVIEQHFHCTFWRSYPRETTYKSSWSAISFFTPCAFCQFGTLTGIEGIHPSASFELLPALVASQHAMADGVGGKLVSDPVHVSPSLGIHYAIGPATGVELTLNPDFSQVESDATQVSANTTFALFYPERRPFFQDGSDIFNTFINAVYTRSINSPIVAAKIIHRDEATSIAYLGAIDEHTPMIIPLEEKSVILSDLGHSVSNILRASHTFGDNLYFGALLTDRRYEDKGSNTVAGFDGHAQLFENVELIGQSLYSYTQELTTLKNNSLDRFDAGKYSAEFDGEHFGGFKNYFSIQRFTSGLDAQLSYNSSSPLFRTGNGFIFNNNLNSFYGWVGYKAPLSPERPSYLKWLLEIDGTVAGSYAWNGEQQVKSRVIKPGLDFSFIGRTDFHAFCRFSNEMYHGVQLNDLYQLDFRITSHPAQWLSLGSELTVGNDIARFLAVPEVGKEFDFNFWVRLKPVAGLLIEPDYTFSQLDSPTRAHYYSGAIYRAKVTYQFSRSLDLRCVVQYDEFGRGFELDPLLTYKLNPFTSFFIGSSHNYYSSPETAQLQPSERQIFAKVQYLFE